MILLPSQWHDLYSGIREDTHNSSEKKISIFVSGSDCDSICALKVLQVRTSGFETNHSVSTSVVCTASRIVSALLISATRNAVALCTARKPMPELRARMQAILMASQISFSTYLIGYRRDLTACLKQEFGTDVMVRCSSVQLLCCRALVSLFLWDGTWRNVYMMPVTMQDYRTAFCINCGANEDVHDVMDSLGPAAQQFVRLVFIDSHRPIHHSLHNDDNHSCVLLHDPDCGDSPLESIPSAIASLEIGTGVTRPVHATVVENVQIPPGPLESRLTFIST